MKIVISYLFSIIGIFCFCATGFSQTSGFVKTNGINTHILEWGKGRETIVLIHGLADTAEIWKDLAPRLARKYRVIAPDRRGAGKSERPRADYDTENLATDAEQLLDALRIKKAVVIGHSFGGQTALTLATRAPAKVEKVVLIEGGFWRKREPAPLRDCAPPADEDCLISNYLQGSVNEYDAETLFPKLRAPALLILGLPRELAKPELNDEEKANKIFFDEVAAEIENIAKNRLKNAKLLIVRNANHWVFNDQPEIVADEIEKFIERK